MGINRFFFFFLAVAVFVADNDPKAAQRFADDTTVSDSLSLGVGVGGRGVVQRVLVGCSHDK